MKLYLTHSSGFDYDTELYQPLKQSIAKEYEVFFPHDTDKNGSGSEQKIIDSTYVLAEVSFPSTGQGIELGWANAHGIPIICFYRSGAKVSTSLTSVTDVFLEYSSPDEMISKLSAWLHAAPQGTNG